MPLQTQGPISLANIQTEFGGSNPISLSEYYKGGIYVSNAVVANIPTSGTISISQFYNASAVARPLVSQLSVNVSEGSTTFSIQVILYLATANTAGVTQNYSINMYYNGSFYTNINIGVPNGTNVGTYNQGTFSKTANYGTVYQYALYGVCEGVTSNTVLMATQYDSSPPSVAQVFFSTSGGTGPGTTYFYFYVYLNRVNLTGGTLNYTLSIQNSDTPDLLADQSTSLSIPNGDNSGSQSLNFTRVNIGFQHYVDSSFSTSGYTSNTVNWQAGY